MAKITEIIPHERRKLLLIVNPRSGMNGYHDCLADVLMVFHRYGYVTTTVFTDEHGSASSIAREHAAEYARVVCMGGDGTLGETVSGLMELPVKARPPLGYIPMGTVNDSAATFGISKNPLQAAKTAACGIPCDQDIGRSSGGYFTYVAAFGAFTEVSYETPQDQKNLLGRGAYFLDGVSRLSKLTHRRCRIEYDDGVLEGDYILVSVTNSYSVAGILRLHENEVSLDDGLFEVLLIRTPENILDLGPTLNSLLKGSVIHGGYDSSYVTLLHTRKIIITCAEPVAWTLDGEDGGTHSVMICENMRCALRIAGEKRDGPK